MGGYVALRVLSAAERSGRAVALETRAVNLSIEEGVQGLIFFIYLWRTFDFVQLNRCQTRSNISLFFLMQAKSLRE
jgi:hypothetical protein